MATCACRGRPVPGVDHYESLRGPAVPARTVHAQFTGQGQEHEIEDVLYDREPAQFVGKERERGLEKAVPNGRLYACGEGSRPAHAA